MTHNPDWGYIDVPGGRLYQEAEGIGPALTLIHAGVAHLRMWDAQVEAWRDHFRVIRYDTRGFGRTATEDVPYSNVDDLALLLDALGVHRTHLLGASRGAIIATDFTLLYPDRVSSLVWVAGGLRGFDVEDPRLTETFKEMERLEEARDWEPLVELETQVWTDGPGQPADRVDPELRRQMIGWNMQNYLAEQPANQLIRPSVIAAEHLAEISVPALFVWGTLDELGVIRAGEKLASEVRGARSSVFEGAAHMVNLERPKEFNKVVLDFLLEVEAQAEGRPARGDSTDEG
jgi:pimeloyl-ACP methyl ester carboxylesterase